MAIRIVSDPETLTNTGALPADAGVEERALHALRNVMDPELPLNVYDLGLIYGLAYTHDEKRVHITMTLTAPNCPVAEELPKQVQAAVAAATGYTTSLTLTFDPPWSKETLPLEAKLALGIL